MKEILIAYRKKHGLTQKQFCELCGISRDLLSRLERGELTEPRRAVQFGRIEKLLQSDSADKDGGRCESKN